MSLLPSSPLVGGTCTDGGPSCRGSPPSDPAVGPLDPRTGPAGSPGLGRGRRLNLLSAGGLISAEVASRPSFEDFYRENYGPGCRALAVALGDQLLAEDSAQEAFVRAYVRWGRVRAMERPAGWVYVVGARVALHARSRKQGRQDSPAPTRDVAEDVVTRETIRQAMAQLSDRQRIAVVLRYLADLSLSDVASGMNCAVGTVKSTLHAALTYLNVELEQQPEEVICDARG